jgi:DNA-binding transcriptional LysR family regulator
VDLNGLQTFVSVVRFGGFAAAARQLGEPRSSVSLRIRSLEKALGTRLFKRSTRAMALTSDGEELYRQSVDAVTALATAVADVLNKKDDFSGQIRFTAPADFPTSVLADAIAAFRRMYPGVTFELLLDNSVIDLISNNIDLALRLGMNSAQDNVVQRALSIRMGLFASTRFVERTGLPCTVSALTHIIGPREAMREFIYRAAGDAIRLPYPFDITVDNFQLVRDLVLLDQGIGLLPKALCAEHLRLGNVVPVLANLVSPSLRMVLCYPSRADMSRKVREFARFLLVQLESALGTTELP